MNLSTRYCVRTLRTTSPPVCSSTSISGRRRACVVCSSCEASNSGTSGWTERSGGGGTWSSRSMAAGRVGMRERGGFSTGARSPTRRQRRLRERERHRAREGGRARTAQVLEPEALDVARRALVRLRVVVVLDEVDDVGHGEHAWSVVRSEEGGSARCRLGEVGRASGTPGVEGGSEREATALLQARVEGRRTVEPRRLRIPERGRDDTCRREEQGGRADREGRSAQLDAAAARRP